jgi:hypothetical protein
MAIDSNIGFTRAAFKNAAAQHRMRIAGWADKSRPTNPLALAESLLPEIEELTKWIITVREIRVSETVIYYNEKQPVIPGSSSSRVVRRWYKNESYFRYNGISNIGEVDLAYIVKPRIQDFDGNVPYRYNFTKSVGIYYNYTDPILAPHFQCLKTDDRYDSWDAEPSSNWTVTLTPSLKALFEEKFLCVKNVYKEKWARLQELRELRKFYLDTAKTIADAANRLNVLSS